MLGHSLGDLIVEFLHIAGALLLIDSVSVAISLIAKAVAMSVIKREESPEPPIAAVAPAVSRRDLECPVPTSIPESHDGKLTMPRASSQLPPLNPSTVTRQTHRIQSPYYGNSPWKYKFSSGRLAKSVRLPNLPRLPTDLGCAVATSRVNNAIQANIPNTAARATHSYNNPVASDQKIELTAIQPTRDTMDGNPPDDNLTGLPSLWNADHGDVDIVMPRRELESIQTKVHRQEQVIRELVTYHQHIYETIGQLNTRVTLVESQQSVTSMTTLQSNNNAVPALGSAFSFRATTDNRSRSPSPGEQTNGSRKSHREGRTGFAAARRDKKKENALDLRIQVPGKMMTGRPRANLLTPMTVTTMPQSGRYVNTPKTPITPGRVGPPSGMKKSNTSIHKRHIHNLDRMVPPASAQIPLVPLTDTEIIVYFFNSLSRPIVSLRLYANNWGPKEICDVLNEHRIIDPPYLRNTCSVKCTTAIKKGRGKYGDDWEIENRALFKSADPCKATDLIRLSGEEAETAADYDIRALCIGLRSHPKVDVDGGIFTRCVMYCQEHNASYKLSDVWQLAVALDGGDSPMRLATPESPSYVPTSNHSLFSQEMGTTKAGNEHENMKNVAEDVPVNTSQVTRTSTSTETAGSDNINDGDFYGDTDSSTQST